MTSIVFPGQGSQTAGMAKDFYDNFKINQALMTSIVFPGQGSQTVGMVRDFYNNFKKAKLLFEEIEDYTNINLKEIIF